MYLTNHQIVTVSIMRAWPQGKKKLLPIHLRSLLHCYKTLSFVKKMESNTADCWHFFMNYSCLLTFSTVCLHYLQFCKTVGLQKTFWILWTKYWIFLQNVQKARQKMLSYYLLLCRISSGMWCRTLLPITYLRAFLS